MAHIYMSNGVVLRVSESRNEVLLKLRQTGDDSVDFQIDFTAGGAVSMETVTISTRQVALVSDRPLPQ